MKPRNGAIAALLLLATCNDVQDPAYDNDESARLALGKVPASEIATWTEMGVSSTPDGRYLQAAAFDEARKVLVMFGGQSMNPSSGTSKVNNEMWEWSPTTGRWTNRTAIGTKPQARSGAGMVFDSGRNKLVLFGGRAETDANFEDTWEWDPTTGAWTDLTTAGTHPSARSQHGMVYDKSTGKILLFGGGRGMSYSADGTGIAVSFGDTWQFDPATGAWTQVSTTTAPPARHDMGLVWDSARNKAVLFGGMQNDLSGVPGVPKQDTWEWDPSTGTWTERTAFGAKPSQRYGHSMSYDPSRGKVVLFGGWDMTTDGRKNDLWDWDPTSAAWTERLSGSETGIPTGRMYASLVPDESRARLLLVAGASTYSPYGTGGIIFYPYYSGGFGLYEVWELDPATLKFTDRTAPLDIPSPRTSCAMAYNPSTSKVYVFGGYDQMQQPLGDLWEWNGATWVQVRTDYGPSPRADAAMAYDPVRKSLILYGGTSYWGNTIYNETWEWNGKWSQLKANGSLDGLYGHGMVTDTGRNKILLFGGQGNYWTGTDGGPIMPPRSIVRNDVWEWDGAQMTWTKRTAVTSSSMPTARTNPLIAFDEGRQKLFLFDGGYISSMPGQSTSAFWEWDPVSAGWAFRDPGDPMGYTSSAYVAYDPVRRRTILTFDNGKGIGSMSVWELDSRGPTWYQRSISAPDARYQAEMTFDAARGVAVLFGGQINRTTFSEYTNETWVYKVTNWGNGVGCNSTTASSCASGYCVEGVCCETSSCSGPCKSCNVAGSEGACVLAKAGTEVPGSCSDGQACDGSGNCKAKNGQTCTTTAECASGNCVDGVCCDTACKDVCKACNLTGRLGKCSPHAAASDPDNECGKGSGACKSTCDGVGSCSFPPYGVVCGDCLVCDGNGTCNMPDKYCYLTGGTGGYRMGGAGGYYTTARGGSGSGGYRTGGSGGTSSTGGSGSGGYRTGGAGGAYTTARGGSGGSSYVSGGSGGYTTGRGGSGGFGGTWYPSGGMSGGGTSGFLTGQGGTGGRADGGQSDAKRDGGPGETDALTTAKLRSSGCSCDVGEARGADGALGPGLLLMGVAVLARRWRRRRR